MSTTVNGIDEIKTLAGADLGVTGWLEIPQEQVNAFAEVTNDHQWIHTDPERAASGPFKATIAHGYLTVSLLIPLFNELLDVRGVGMAVNYGLNKLRFPAPVPVGSRIRLAGRVVSAEEVPGGVQVTLAFTVEVENAAKPAVVAEAVYRFYA
ncbi:MaoC family dehydratase [Nonomuraea sp. NBC_01738]|uniref:MaoC family dehydratase n=1 Tax=Nonomuraea sp. NBC_01738 TaxID=2976003 RepID=UPI002E0EDB38|nr:MaoC family dehydratase [Nonomuraea sp. NBC_01738]